MGSAQEPREGKDHLGSFLDAITDDDDDPSSKRVREKVLGAGRVIGDRYKLGDRIARGGMATIWEATDTKLNRIVAIKFMGQAYTDDAEYRKRFEEEARAAAQLHTPFVVAIHDHGVTEGVPFIVMERLQGEDLHQRMHRLKRLPIPFVAKVATEAGKALKIAHGAGIVHRDLKPKNLFIAKDDDDEVIKLLDFGVAKHAGTAALMTATGVMLGSPFYMSPEQIRCERNLDGRTDLWSLAAILYRALTGIKAFDGDMARVMFQITRERPKAPSQVCPDLAREFDVFFDKALATKRENRFSTAAEFVEAFNGAVKASGREHAANAIVPPAPPSQSGTRDVRKPAAPPAPPLRSGAQPPSPPSPGYPRQGPPPNAYAQAGSGQPGAKPVGAQLSNAAAFGPPGDASPQRPRHPLATTHNEAPDPALLRVTEEVAGPPSDHPTFAAPVGILSNLVQDKANAGTGLRFGAPGLPGQPLGAPFGASAAPGFGTNAAPPAAPSNPFGGGSFGPIPPPAPSGPNLAPVDFGLAALNAANLTPEQKSGFATAAAFDANNQWQAYVGTSLPPMKPKRSLGAVFAVMFVIALAIGLTITAVMFLR